MTTAVGLRSRLATVLVRWAAQVLPGSRRSWGVAMQNELAYVGGDWQALRWACGCLVAATGERVRRLAWLEPAPVRVVIALLIVCKVFDDLFATALTMVYKASALGMAGLLGQLTAGDDFTRFIPLMEAVPMWLHGLWVLAAALYAMAVVRFALRRGPAHGLVVAALGVEIAANLLSRPIVVATGVVVNPEPSLLAGFVLPWLLPAGLALVLWGAGSGPESRVQTG